MSSIQERLKIIRKSLGLSQDELAVKTDAKRTTVAGYEAGVSLPHAEFLASLNRIYGINSNWLLTGEGNMYLKEEPLFKSLLEQGLDETIAAHPKFSEIETRLSALESLIIQEKTASGAESDDNDALYTSDRAPAYGEEEETERVPYAWDIAAGPPIAMDEDRSETVAVPARLLRKGGRYYAATVRGGSMAEAGIRDGDMVLVRCADAPRDGAVQVVRYRDKSTLKLLREVEGKGWELHYRDGSGRVIECDSDEYETQGEFEAILPPSGQGRKTRQSP